MIEYIVRINRTKYGLLKQLVLLLCLVRWLALIAQITLKRIHYLTLAPFSSG
jgi:hypothetical protein